MRSRRAEAVPEGFRAFVVRTFGDEGRGWLERLPAVLAELSERWQLELGPELPGGLLACVRAATMADGTSAVLKIARSPSTTDEIAGLRAWGGRGAPELYAADESLSALLLERIEPGTHPESASADAVAELLRTLRAVPPAGLPPLAENVRQRVEDAVRDGRASEQKGLWAIETISRLEEEAPTPALVHGDFDERNFLRCARRGLAAIDPIPCSGDPAYDAGTWVHGNRRPGRRARLDAIVAATGLPRERVRDWAAVVAVHG